MNISAQQFRELLDRYLNNTASAREREILDKFFDSYKSRPSEDDFRHYTDLQEEILREIHARLPINAKRKRNRAIGLWLPLAAVISLFVLAYFYVDEVIFERGRTAAISVVEERSIPGQKMMTRLPDGTVVHLNGDSKISYSENFGGSIREVAVTGEAYFEVVRNGQPFVVHADRMRTEVIGTSFNVRNRSGETVEVTLVEGKVNVISTAGASSVLSPNQKAVVDLTSGKISTHEVNILAYTSWKDNIIYFEQTTLKDAIATLEGWYAVTIDVLNPALEKCVITAKYQDEPLGNVLSSFQFLLNLDITRVNKGHYTIKGTGCK